MGDNLNANGAAPVAQYVFLSFLFEILIEFMIYFVLIRIKSRSNFLIYSTGATSPTASPVSWTAWSMPPRSSSSTTMSARCHFGARRRTSCITSRSRPSITTGPWQGTSRDVLPVHRAGVAGGSPPPASLGGGRQRLPLDRGHRRGPRRPPPHLYSVCQGRRR